MSSLIGKARKPKFELHLKIHDLNNVPLVSGSSFIKWHLPHSMTAEHRGRTNKCLIANHRVEYGFSKVVPGIRMSLDKQSHLVECPIEFEVVQEFQMTEKIVLGNIRLNLAEYVEESEAFFRDISSPPPNRRRANSAALNSPTNSAPRKPSDEVLVHKEADDGIVRRYLMQDSKVNSTLKISILLIQTDGERSFVAPALKTAPVFGGIAGLVAPDQVEDETGPLPTISKNREVSEIQDLYRSTLAASWSRQPSELPADECIEDIFSGGNGWKTKPTSRPSSRMTAFSIPDTEDEFEESDIHHDTLRPSDFRRNTSHHQHHGHHCGHGSFLRYTLSHRRTHSNSSDKSVSTVTGVPGGISRSSLFKRGTASPNYAHSRSHLREENRESSLEDDAATIRSMGSIVSLAPTTGSSERERHEANLKRMREFGEFELRDDLVAWTLPSLATTQIAV